MATITKPDRALIAAFGPMKMEVIQLTSVNTTSDTVTSKLASPSFAFAMPAADAGASGTSASCTVSGKTVTINDAPTSAMTLFVFGDSLS
jgi:hypothetical protein